MTSWQHDKGELKIVNLKFEFNGQNLKFILLKFSLLRSLWTTPNNFISNSWSCCNLQFLLFLLFSSTQTVFANLWWRQTESNVHVLIRSGSSTASQRKILSTFATRTTGSRLQWRCQLCRVGLWRRVSRKFSTDRFLLFFLLCFPLFWVFETNLIGFKN